MSQNFAPGNDLTNKPTLIIGLGNPYLGDDGVGWIVADILKEEFASRLDLEFENVSLGGLHLMERLIGYDQVILIDAIKTNKRKHGHVETFSLDFLPDLTAGHSSSAHDTSLRNAIKFGKNLNLKLPDEKNIQIVAIEAEHVYEFSTILSKEVLAAVPLAVNLVKELV